MRRRSRGRRHCQILFRPDRTVRSGPIQGIRHWSNRADCAGKHIPVWHSSTLHTAHSRRRRASVGRPRPFQSEDFHLEPTPSALDVGSESRILFDCEGIAGKMRGLQRKTVGERPLPALQTLAGEPIHQIETDICESGDSGLSHRCDGLTKRHRAVRSEQGRHPPSIPRRNSCE